MLRAVRWGVPCSCVHGALRAGRARGARRVRERASVRVRRCVGVRSCSRARVRVRVRACAWSRCWGCAHSGCAMVSCRGVCRPSGERGELRGGSGGAATRWWGAWATWCAGSRPCGSGRVRAGLCAGVCAVCGTCTVECAVGGGCAERGGASRRALVRGGRRWCCVVRLGAAARGLHARTCALLPSSPCSTLMAFLRHAPSERARAPGSGIAGCAERGQGPATHPIRGLAPVLLLAPQPPPPSALREADVGHRSES